MKKNVHIVNYEQLYMNFYFYCLKISLSKYESNADIPDKNQHSLISRSTDYLAKVGGLRIWN